MALRSAIPEEMVPSPTTKTYIRPTWEPRDERARPPKSVTNRGRPAPIRLLTPPEASSLASPPLPFKDTTGIQYQVPLAPEIVDHAAPTTRPRRGAPIGPPPKRAPPSIRIASPSLHSRCSTSRRSEISFGILDYYTREPSPLPSPDLPPPPPPPKMDPAMKQFDFQLASLPSGTQGVALTSVCRPQELDATQAGAQQESAPLVDVPLPTQTASPAPHKRTYSLFPAAKESPIPATTSVPLPPSPVMISPTSTISSITIHQAPDPSYRPRKVSLSNSMRSRKDSFTSFRSNRRIPLRILSSNSSTPSATGRLNSRAASISTSSPPDRLLGHNSRWSDESTITSPTGTARRTSFGSLLQELSRDGGPAGRASESGPNQQYSGCFFEDDEDETAPLRKKFGWTRRSTSLTVKEIPLQRKHRGSDARGRFNDRPGLGIKIEANKFSASIAAIPLTPQQQRDQLCDQIFAPVLGTLIAVSMTDNIMRTSNPNRSLQQTLHDHPERVGAGTVLQVLEHLRGQYMNDPRAQGRNPLFAYRRHVQEDAEPLQYTEESVGVAQLRKLQNSLRLSMIANLGTTCFGYVYEHFPQLNPGNQIAEVAFGLDDRSTQAAFETAYPSTGFNVAWNPQGPNWLPRMIRNAFAHANWEILPNERVRLWNWNVRNQGRTFDITMSGSDLQKLIYEALRSVINNVLGQQPGLLPTGPPEDDLDTTEPPGDDLDTTEPPEDDLDTTEPPEDDLDTPERDERPVLSHEIILSFIDKSLSGDALELLSSMD
ncbi:hypothetical protein LTR12_010917 [Friedmanniomyces endolithicus]|nr:hypothetical protein LTR12_010917 [Friedmanniomyces endolithicus]